MKPSRLTTILAAAGMAMASVSASAALPSIDRAAPAIGASSFLQDDDGDGPGSTAIILGVVLVVLIAAVAISGNDDPESP